MKRAAMPDLFDPPAEKPAHDPGGKVATALPRGMTGDAEFYGVNGEYRLWLSRTIGETDGPYLLWNGMNPSEARADVNDPTVTREINFTKAWGYIRYFKTNVMDYRATHPRQLLDPTVTPRSDRNLETILRLAKGAERIVLCHGVLHKKLQPYADEAIAELRRAGLGWKLYCMGRTLMGHPRHPLYLSSETPLESF